MIPTTMNSLINLPKSERTFAVALVKLFRESVKKTLKEALVSPTDLDGLSEMPFETFVALRKFGRAATVPYEFFDAVTYREKNKSEISTKRGIKTGIANLQV